MKFTLFSLLTLLVVSFVACEHDPPTPISELREVCFETEVLPIFQTQCAISGCHNSITKERGYILDTYENILKKGVEPNQSSNSLLYEVMSNKIGGIMPPSGPPVNADQRALIRAWIDQGAKNNAVCDTLK